MPNRAYRDIQLENDSFFRVFEHDCEDEELHWHRDRADRRIEVVHGTGWKFQYENKNPIELMEGDVISVNQMDYHRLIKGDTNLILKIVETV